jgi:DNA-binding HxlR family transcriptional regulator
MRDYGQFCPIARSSELLAERWTPIIVRNLLNGCRTFNEIRQGAPGISTALLAQRLESLERSGVLVRAEAARARRDVRAHRYGSGSSPRVRRAR